MITNKNNSHKQMIRNKSDSHKWLQIEVVI